MGGIQQQAILVNFIVTKLEELKSHILEKVFKICYLTLQPSLDDKIKQLIDSLIKTDAISFKKLQLDLQPLIKGDVAPQKKFSLPVEKILKPENERDEQSQCVNHYPQKGLDNLIQLLESIKMSEYFPGKLKFIDVVSVNSRSDQKDITSLPWILIKTIMIQNSSIYNTLETQVKRIQNGEKSEPGGNADKQQKHKFLKFLGRDKRKSIEINPLDLIVAVFMCSSQPLKQAIAAKMHTSKLAIPVVFPQEPMIFSIGILRSILISTQRATVLECPCNVLSFIRIGRPRASKSKLTNEFLSEKYHDTFFNQDTALGNMTRVVSDGVIETAIMTTAKTEKTNNQQIVTMVFNLRGDAYHFQAQKTFLSSISTGLVIFTTYEELESSTFMTYWNDIKDKKVTIMLDATSKTENDLENVARPYLPTADFVILAMEGEGAKRKSLDIVRELQEYVKDVLTNQPKHSLLKIAEICKYKIDDDSLNLNERIDADELITCISMSKKDMLPLQDEPLSTLSNNMKKMYKRSEYKTPEHKVELKYGITMSRRKQLGLIPNLHPFMITFLKSMLSRLHLNDGCLEMLALWMKSNLEKTRRNAFIGNTSRVDEDLETKVVFPVDMPLEFEHLIREMGQLYETIMEQKSMVDSDTLELVKKFPILPAKLLISGTPFELMNGDLVHVPITWVKAVLNEVIHLVGDKSCLILSVVGIQSSGKSTLLNIMFGLQFPVGYGRITKGAFVQLVPVYDVNLPFKYILVIDTEGLRAPEWGDESYLHDTQFATFVIGLADINIINIKGENMAEMNDVLQMVVHVLLKLKLANDKLNLKQSCLFVHQNMDCNTDIASSTTPNHFIDNLNKKTVQIAEELGFADVHLISDVIDFKTNYIWNFPDLLEGSPPMKHTSKEYSLKAAELKKEIIAGIALSDKTYFTISETSSRIEFVWDGILMENFAFDFRNALEMKAFTTLDRKYWEMQWELESLMSEYIQVQRFAIRKCMEKSEMVQIVADTIDRIPNELRKKSDLIQKDFEDFIDKSTLKNVMIRWGHNYLHKMQSSLPYICEISIKEVKSIMDSIKQTEECNRVVNECEKKINSLATELASGVTRSKHESCFLKDTFDEKWMDWLVEVSPDENCGNLSISGTVKHLVRQVFLELDVLWNNLEELTDEKCMMMTTLQGVVGYNDLTIGKHISINTSIKPLFMQSKKQAHCLNFAVDFTAKMFTRIETYLLNLDYEDTKFKEIYMKDILKMIEDSIAEHNRDKKGDGNKKGVEKTKANGNIMVDSNTKEDDNKKENGIKMEDGNGKEDDNKNWNGNKKDTFKFLPQYKVLILTHVSKYCIKKFTELDQRYEQKHNPRARLVEYKPTAWSLFQNLVDSKSENVIAADIFQEAIKESILEYLDEVVQELVEDALLRKFKHSKYEVMKTVMKDLVKMKQFHYFNMYISAPEIFVEQWIINHTNEVLFTKNGSASSKYEELCRSKLEKENVFRDIKRSVNASVLEVEGKNGSFISQWIDIFISNTHVLPIAKDRLLHVQNRNVTDVKEFQRAILTRLEKTFEEIIVIVGDKTTKNICWKRSPYKRIFARLWGCCETCPFCNEPCEHTDRDHLRSVKHSCRQHRPQGIADYAWKDGSGPLLTEECYSLIQTNESITSGDSKTKYKYRHYRTKYPEWEMSPTVRTSKYWMWYFNKYRVEIAEMNNAKQPKISKEWQQIDDNEALESL